jgi:hypothetical protein
MNGTLDPLEVLWNDLLSRETDKISAAYASLDAASRRSVIEHLRRMISEPDWHPEQRTSAQIALEVLSE